MKRALITIALCATVLLTAAPPLATATPPWPQSYPAYFSALQDATPPAEKDEVCGENASRPVPIFGGNPDAGHSDHHGMFTLLQHADGGHHSNDPNEDYTDITQWSVYPQKSQNAHVVIGALTVVLLYIWGCNLLGLLSLSKAFMLNGLTEIAQGGYLLFWLFYLLHPQDLKALHNYVLNDVMELQHMAISSCLIVAGLWDVFMGLFLHYELPIFIDSYNRKIIKDQHGKTIQPNNLAFYQRAIPIIITVAHILNGSNFISHPQHTEDNTFGHVLLGITMMCGAVALYWVRVRHVCWKYLAQQINPTLRYEEHFNRERPTQTNKSRHVLQNGGHHGEDGTTAMSAEDGHGLDTIHNVSTSHNDNNNNNNNNNNNDDDDAEVWEVNARYSFEDLQTMYLSQNQTWAQSKKKTISSWVNAIDIFAFDDAPPANLQPQSVDDPTSLDALNGPTGATDGQKQNNNNNNNNAQKQFLSKKDIHDQWNLTHLLTVEYKKSTNKDLHRRYEWNSVSDHFVVNCIYNIVQYCYHVAWVTKTKRELIAWSAALVAGFNFSFIAWLLMMFVEPPVRFHYQHYWECSSEYLLVQITIFINVVLSWIAVGYLLMTILHQARLIRAPWLYTIRWLQKE